jgi:divalent metal cation (Fe/Co/Zn/Cd) transporter
MLGTILLKGACWVWSRGIANSAIQALAQDALTDVLFNSFSLLFPLIGTAMRAWWLDPLGGLFLAGLVIALWSRTAAAHLRQLSGCAAHRDTRAVLLYLTMRFAGKIQKITALRAWHAGDGVLVEVDVVMEEGMRLRDSHDLTESLQYVLESVPGVERAWVHADYRAGNLSGHVAREE